MENASYYVYLHRRLSDNGVFYVGKGRDKRAYEKRGRSQYWGRIVAKHGYTVEIVQDHLQEWYAFELEKDLIAYYGRENLCNLTDGGEGASGRIVDAEVRQKISKAQSGALGNNYGKKHSEEHKRKMSLLMSGSNSPSFGAKVSQATKQKQSLAKQGCKHPNFGKHLPEATRQKIGIAHKGKHVSKETREKISSALQGKCTEAQKSQLASLIKHGAENSKAKKTMCIDNAMVFGCVADAVKWLHSIGVTNASQPNISTCAAGKRPVAYGFKWQYV